MTPAPGTDPAHETAQTPLRVLVVDDDEQSRLQATRLLGETNAEYLTVNDGQEAIEELGRASYDLILLDLNMPRVTGLQVLDWMRDNLTGRRPYVLVHSVTRTSTRELTTRGADAFVPKPLTRERLAAAMAAARAR